MALNLNYFESDLEPLDDGGAVALLDWRRQVAQVYADVRAAADAERAWREWRRARDHLFKTHPQSPLDARTRSAFGTLPFFGYDRSLRVRVALSRIEGDPVTIDGGGDGAIRMSAFARTDGLRDRLGGELTLFWLAGYGGGLFLPFADATNGRETYGGGRYLLDTIKGADLGGPQTDELILDFNFAYNPSCAYSTRYVCPLAPPSNRLSVRMPAGEMLPG
jgi:uncharacterized protein (DUF1684 family)